MLSTNRLTKPWVSWHRRDVRLIDRGPTGAVLRPQGDRTRCGSGRPSRPWVANAVLTVGVLSYAVQQSMTTPALPLIQEQLGTSQSSASWILTTFLLSSAVAVPIAGRIGDAYGKQRIMVISLLFLAAGGVLAASADTLWVMLAARVVQGFGAGTFPLSFSIIRDEFPPSRVAGAIGMMSSMQTLGFTVGMVLSGPLVGWLGYHALFWLPSLLAVAAAILVHLLVPESTVRTRAPIAPIPVVLMTAWLVLFILGVSKGPTWPAPTTALVLIGAVSGFALWVVIELRARVPFIDLRLLRTRDVWAASAVAMLIGVAIYAMFSLLPQFLQAPTSTGYGFGATLGAASLMVVPSSATTFVASLWSARLSRLIGPRLVIATGCLAVGVGAAGLGLFHEYAWQICLAGAVSGVGSGLAFAALANAVLEAVPVEHSGTALGMNANLRTIGGTIGIAVMTSLVTVRLQADGYPEKSGYVTGFLFLAVAAGLAATVALLITGVRGGSPDRHSDKECLETPRRG